MVKKSATRRLSVADRHEQVIERLTRIETQLAGLPQKVEKLEAHRNWLAGAFAVVSAIFAYMIHGK